MQHSPGIGHILKTLGRWCATRPRAYAPLSGLQLKDADQHSANAWRRLLLNISPQGAARGVVVASPSKRNPNYFFHWVRDAALVMGTVVTRYERAGNPRDKAEAFALLNDYSARVRKLQLLNTLTGLGEPKYNADGSAFDGPWGRPQNDGPALRAVTFIRFARKLIDEGQVDLAKKLYGRGQAAGIKRDLEYVSHRWSAPCFDYWEEVRGQHFTTLAAQRRAMLDGATLAEALDDPSAAQWYRQQGTALEKKLDEHWDAQKGIFVVTRKRDAGHDYKHSGLDAAVVLAALHAQVEGDSRFSVTDDRILATALKIRQAFQKLYPINHNGRPGVAIGRYPEDRYNGNGTSEGNPWFLATNAFGELYYKAAQAFIKRGSLTITDLNRPFFASVVDEATSKELVVGQSLEKDHPLFRKLIAGLIQNGDGYLQRSLDHGHPNGSFSEQINRYTGYMQGARDLTWSYASLITALQARQALDLKS